MVLVVVFGLMVAEFKGEWTVQFINTSFDGEGKENEWLGNEGKENGRKSDMSGNKHS